METFREMISNTMAAPLRRLRTLRGRAPESEMFWALRDVTFDVEHGEVVGIIGKNGAGKSTLLKILSRITEPTEGRAVLRGRVTSLLEVGTGFHPELTGRENVYLNGSILGMRRKEIARKFDEIAAFAEVEKFLDTPVKRYSSGMYVRLAFAVAAHLEPEILVVDEVLAVGDAQFQRKCLAKMGEVGREGRAVLFVSHNMAALQNICRTGIILKEGKVDYRGPIEEAARRYLSATGAREITDLRGVKDRTGNGQVRVTSIAVCDLGGRPVTGIGIGEGCSIDLDYESAEGVVPVNVEVGVALLSVHGVKTVMFSNLVAGYPFEQLPPRGKIRCVVPSLPIAEGSYLVGVSISCNGETNDWVDRAARFDVYPSDFYESGRTYNPGSTQLYLRHRWDRA